MKLKVAARSLTGKKVKTMRKDGFIPAIVYGQTMDAPQSISFFKNDFLKIYRETGIAVPIDFEGDLKETVIIKDIAVDPVSDELLHVDFLAVNKDQLVQTDVPLVFVGESSIEKMGEGQLQYVKDSVHIEAKPADLPKEIEVDISVIVDSNDVLTASSLTLPSGVTLLDDAEQAIVTVSALTEEVEEDEATEGAEGEAPAEGGDAPAEEKKEEAAE